MNWWRRHLSTEWWPDPNCPCPRCIVHRLDENDRLRRLAEAQRRHPAGGRQVRP